MLGRQWVVQLDQGVQGTNIRLWHKQTMGAQLLLSPQVAGARLPNNAACRAHTEMSAVLAIVGVMRKKKAHSPPPKRRANSNNDI